MNFEFSSAAEALRSEIRTALKAEWPLGRLGYREPENALDYEAHKVFRKSLARHGWFGVGIPEAYGGCGGSKELQYVVAAELAYHGVPYPEVAVNMVAHTILNHGSEDLKQRFLPRIARGEIEFSLGLSEPNAGSDLASLRTAASREDGRWVINGQKIYTSYIHRSEYCLMAVRTDASGVKHKGISLLIVDVTTPGIVVRPLWGMGDIRTNLTFWDNVEVPEENIIGEENAGWGYLNTHLDIERLTSFTVDALRAPFDDLVAHVGSTDLRNDPHVRSLIGQLSTEIEVLESLSRHTLWLVDSEGHTRYESSQVKVVASELRQKLARLGLEIFGESGQLVPGDSRAPLGGALFRAAEAAVMQTYGAGANEIQREIIARRGLGLGRSA